MSNKLRLAHVVFQTNRVKAMRDFYCHLLQAEIVFENEHMCFITYDDEHHRLAFMAMPGGLLERPPNGVGLMHSAYTFESLDALLARYSLLKDDGLEPVAPVQHGPTTSLYYRDPDGSLAELQIDNFASPLQATEFMHSEEYIDDPLGPVFNPERMLQALSRGTPEQTLITREWARDDSQVPSALARLSWIPVEPM